MVKKDFYLDKHSEEVNIPNVEVMALLKSFKSKGLVKVHNLKILDSLSLLSVVLFNLTQIRRPINYFVLYRILK